MSSRIRKLRIVVRVRTSSHPAPRAILCLECDNHVYTQMRSSKPKCLCWKQGCYPPIPSLVQSTVWSKLQRAYGPYSLGT